MLIVHLSNHSRNSYFIFQGTDSDFFRFTYINLPTFYFGSPIKEGLFIYYFFTAQILINFHLVNGLSLFFLSFSQFSCYRILILVVSYFYNLFAGNGFCFTRLFIYIICIVFVLFSLEVVAALSFSDPYLFPFKTCNLK